MKKYIIVLLIIILSINCYSQINSGGRPLAFLKTFKSKIDYEKLPSIDKKKLINEDLLVRKNKPYRVGKVFDINIDIKKRGNLKIFDNGDKVWSFGISASESFTLSIIFGKYKLPKGAKVFIYNKNKTDFIGAFTYKNNKASEKLSTMPVKGDSIIIEYFEPKIVDFIGQLVVSQVVYDYKDAFNKKRLRGVSGSCNVNINCTEGADWQIIKKSVLKYTFVSDGSMWFCSGSLINNSRNDGTPYFLTANHCVSKDSETESAIFYFNYESENCDGTTSLNHKTISSSKLIAIAPNNKQDFSLLKLSIMPPEEYSPYMAGWNRSENAAQKTVCIHHPQGDIKKISFDNDVPVTDNYGSGYDYNSHWKVIKWEIGTTESGSSGSPLFDENKHIVGNLTGGDAYCGNSVNDYYSKFSEAWDTYEEDNEQLKYWLDPTNSEIVSLDGYNPYSAKYGNDAMLSDVYSPKGKFCINQKIKPRIIIKNLGTENLTSLIVKYSINSGTKKSLNWTGNLKTLDTISVYFPEFFLSVGNYSLESYCEKPNNVTDENLTNNNYSSTYSVSETTQKPIISGNLGLCNSEFNGSYSTQVSGSYNWSVIGGTIISYNNTNIIDVEWNEWGQKLVNLQFTDVCGTEIIDPFEINVFKHSLKLKLKTDLYGNETSWDIKNSKNEILFSGDNYNNYQELIKSMCFDNGCYTLTVYDSGNNGICCSKGDGYLSLYKNNSGNENLLFSATKFTDKSVFTFCLNNNIVNKEEIVYNIFPNPGKKFMLESKIKGDIINAKIEVFNIEGSKVYEITKFSDRTIIDLSSMKNGIYTIKIYTEFGSIIKNVVKIE